MSKSYRFKCRNTKCNSEFHRYYPKHEFEHHQYNTESGWACFNCGFPRMAVMMSNRDVKNSFQAGWQKSIGAYCRTYQEYKEELKKRGLVEIGYEDLPPKEDESTYKWSDKQIRKLVQNGTLDAMDGQIIEDLKEGNL